MSLCDGGGACGGHVGGEGQVMGGLRRSGEAGQEAAHLTPRETGRRRGQVG